MPRALRRNDTGGSRDANYGKALNRVASDGDRGHASDDQLGEAEQIEGKRDIRGWHTGRARGKAVGVRDDRELVKHDLIDEYRFVVHPVALGKGLTIFDGLEKPRALKLVSSSSFPRGATAQIFARDR